VRQSIMTPCPVCGAPSESLSARPRRCDVCLTWSTQPQPVVERYDAAYYERFYLGRAEARRLTDACRWAEFLPTRPGRLLDVGAGVGHFVQEAGNKGWLAVGVEPSAAGRELAFARYRLSLASSVEEVSSLEFDVVTALDVLQSVAQPRAFLNQCLSVLRKDGVVIVKTPNVPRRLLRIAGALSSLVGRDPWLGRSVRFHYFDRASLPNAARSVGLLPIVTELVDEAGARRSVVGGLSRLVIKSLAVRDSVLVVARLPSGT
jgi:SAM-dependent methyltransferase